MLMQDGVAELIDRLEADGGHRVLRQLKVREGFVSRELAASQTSVGLVVDVETTGTDSSKGLIIELAMRRFRYDAEGRIVKIDQTWSWREDPGIALPDEIVRLTGITDADLAGQTIDDDTATRLLRSADLVVAHNAAFDRKFVERRLPGVAGLAWACSCREIDWPAAGFDGRSLGWLLAQAGWFHAAHRASNDVDAVIALLGRKVAGGRTALAELLESAACPTVRIDAVGADFRVKDDLRARGYRWNGEDRVWWKEVQASSLSDEECWLARHVYAPECFARAEGPAMTEITARERYA